MKIFLNIETDKNKKLKQKKDGLYISYFNTYYIKFLDKYIIYNYETLL